MGTGGIGGVHRGWTERPDVSGDLGGSRGRRSSSSPRVRVDPRRACDRGSARDAGWPDVGYHTDTLRCTSRGWWPAGLRASSPRGRQAEIAHTHWKLGGAGVLVGNPPAQSLDDVEGLIDTLAEAGARASGAGPDAVRALDTSTGRGRANARSQSGARRRQRGVGSRDRHGHNAAVKALLVLPLVVAVGGATPLPGLPSYTAGYASWTKLNVKPIPRRAVDAHSSIKNVYASKLPRAGRYPVGTVIVKEGRQRAGARHADRRDAQAPSDGPTQRLADDRVDPALRGAPASVSSPADRSARRATSRRARPTTSSRAPLSS